jgi:hypothetical protein
MEEAVFGGLEWLIIEKVSFGLKKTLAHLVKINQIQSGLTFFEKGNGRKKSKKRSCPKVFKKLSNFFSKSCQKVVKKL